jgi:hypothetical protein
MAVVKTTKDEEEFPTLAESIPARYKAVVKFLEGLTDATSLDALHAWNDILRFHGKIEKREEELSAVVKRLKTPKTLIDEYIRQLPVGPSNVGSNSTRRGLDNIYDYLNQLRIDTILISKGKDKGKANSKGKT